MAKLLDFKNTCLFINNMLTIQQIVAILKIIDRMNSTSTTSFTGLLYKQQVLKIYAT